jgi:hypothetical protein
VLLERESRFLRSGARSVRAWPRIPMGIIAQEILLLDSYVPGWHRRDPSRRTLRDTLAPLDMGVDWRSPWCRDRRTEPARGARMSSIDEHFVTGNARHERPRRQS